MLIDMNEIYCLMEGLPPGAWVAISTEQRRILSYGDDEMAVFAESKAQGEKIPFIGRVPDLDVLMCF